MPRIPQNIRGHTIGMLNAGMTMNAVTMNIPCSTRAIRHLRQRFQAARSGRPRITTRGHSEYHLRNRFQTSTATAPSTHGTHNNRIYAQTVRNRLHEVRLSAHRPLCWLRFGATSPCKSC